MKATMKKVLSLAMILMMVVSTMVIIPLTTSAEGETVITLADLGAGTQADPYVITTAQQLLDISKAEILGQNGNKKVYMELGADIDMAGVTGFLSFKMKSGHIINFDGKGHKISNLTVTDGYDPNNSVWVGGLFGMLRGGLAGVYEGEGENAVLLGDTIKNLTMENVNVSSPEDFGNRLFGGIIGQAAAPLTMENCIVTGAVTATNAVDTSEVRVGGLVGYLANSNSAEATFVRCVNEATVSSTYTKGTAIGGLVGILEGIAKYTFSYCINKGNVSATAALESNQIGMGGMLGRSEFIFGAGDNAAAQIFENCVNLGDLSIADTTQANGMGGMVGIARTPGDASSGAELKMTNCYDNSARSFSCMFGANGAFAGFPSSKDNFRTFENCYAVNKAGSTNPYTEICYVDQGTSQDVTLVNSGIVTAMDAQITLSDASTTTVAAAIEAIESARLCPAHEFDDDCDATCNNNCGYSRTAPHNYTDDCDAECNDCQATRTAPHAYDNDCDASCNECGTTRTPADHVYYNNCDPDCNVCGATRTPGEHVYDDDKDKFCNSCGEQRELPKPAETTTAAPAETTPVEEKGCKNAINSTYAVLALVGVLGFAFVAKKREEN